MNISRNISIEFRRVITGHQEKRLQEKYQQMIKGSIKVNPPELNKLINHTQGVAWVNTSSDKDSLSIAGNLLDELGASMVYFLEISSIRIYQMRDTFQG